LVEWSLEERASLRQIHPRPMRNPFQAWPKRALHSGDPSALMINVLLVDRRIRRDARIRILKRNDLIREAQLFYLRMMRYQSPTVRNDFEESGFDRQFEQRSRDHRDRLDVFGVLE